MRVPFESVLTVSPDASIQGATPEVVLLVALSNGKNSVRAVIQKSRLDPTLAKTLLSGLLSHGTLLAVTDQIGPMIRPGLPRRHAERTLTPWEPSLTPDPTPDPASAPTPGLNDDDWLILATRAEAAGNLESALWCVERALSISPERAQLHARRAHLRRRPRARSKLESPAP